MNKTYPAGLIRVETLDWASLFPLSYWSVTEYWRLFRERCPDYDFFWSFFQDLKDHCDWSPVDVLASLAMALIITSIRFLLTKFVFHPLALYWEVSRSRIEKIPENLWKIVFYSLTWSYSVYVMWISGRHNWFWDPLSLWEEYDPKMEIPSDICVMYVVQFGYYLHSMYATIYMDSHRKDTFIMMLHHILTLILIGFSYTTKHHMEGALVLLLMDISDVFLEFWKLNSNLKKRAGGKFFKFHDRCGIFGFFGFVVTWFLFRLYWYPLKVLYTGIYGAMAMAPEMPFWILFAVMLLMLFGLNIYWFVLVFCGLYNLFRGKLGGIDDTREYDSDVSEGENNVAVENGPAAHPHED